MLPETLDFAFPFFIFVYGLVMTFVLNCSLLMDLAEKKLPHQILTQFRAHRNLGLICLVCGSFWSLQNLWNY